MENNDQGSEGLLKWLEKQSKYFPNYAGRENPTSNLTETKLSRVEIIEQGNGRTYVHDPRTGEYDIEVAYQDGGRTLKVFITKKQ
jgi:hypothetical protein